MDLRNKIKDKTLNVKNYKILNDLFNKIQELQGSTTKEIDEENEESWLINDRTLIASKDVEIFFEDKENLIIKSLTLKGARFYSKCKEGINYPELKANWCTVNTEAFKSYFPFYIIIRKDLLGTENPERRLQFAFGENDSENDFRNLNDEKINTDLKSEFIYIFKNKIENWFLLKYDFVWDFSEGLARVEKDRYWGFINKEGEEVIPLKYDGVGNFREGLAGLAKVLKDGKYGFINKKSDEVIPLKYDFVWDFKEGLAKVRKGKYWGFINKKDEEVIPLKYDYVWDFKEGLVKVRKGKYWGFFNKKGEEVIPLKYNYVGDFINGKSNVKKDGYWGFINKKGEEIIPLKYDDVGNFREGLVKVRKGKYCGFINKKDEEVIPLKYDYVGNFREGLAQVEKDGKLFYINKKGEKINK